MQGDKKRESSGAADIVTCTTCTAPGACTHTANNGGVSEVTIKRTDAYLIILAC